MSQANKDILQDELYLKSFPICNDCGEKLDSDAKEADRDICFRCYSFQQD